MSEGQLTRLEATLKRLEETMELSKKSQETLEKTKNWFRNSAIAFAIATFALIGSIALNNYRLNRVESEIPLLASRKGVEMLEQVHTMENNATIALLDSTKRLDMMKVYEEGRLIKSQIFVYGMGTARGDKTTLQNAIK